MFIWKLFCHKNKPAQNVPKSLLQKFIGINNIPQFFSLNAGKKRFFRSMLINRGNKIIFQQCNSALIIRGKSVNMHKIRGIFDKIFSFKKSFPYFLEVPFSFFCFVFNLLLSLWFALFHTLFNKDK